MSKKKKVTENLSEKNEKNQALLEDSNPEGRVPAGEITAESDDGSSIWDDEDAVDAEGTGKGGFAAAKRKTGLPRFFELLGRDLGSFFTSGLLFLLGIFPGLAVIYFSIMAGFFPGVILGGAAAGIPGGMLLCGMFDTILRSLRDEPGFWWNNYKKAWKQNAKQGMLFGGIFGVFFGIWGWIILALPDMDNVPVTVWISMILGMLFALIFLHYICAQIVLVSLSNLELLKNAAFFTAGYFPQSLVMGIVAGVYWALCFLYLPYSVAVLLLTGAWLPSVIALMIIYPMMNRVLHIEEKIHHLNERKYGEW